MDSGRACLRIILTGVSQPSHSPITVCWLDISNSVTCPITPAHLEDPGSSTVVSRQFLADSKICMFCQFKNLLGCLKTYPYTDVLYYTESTYCFLMCFLKCLHYLSTYSNLIFSDLIFPKICVINWTEFGWKRRQYVLIFKFQAAGYTFDLIAVARFAFRWQIHICQDATFFRATYLALRQAVHQVTQTVWSLFNTVMATAFRTVFDTCINYSNCQSRSQCTHYSKCMHRFCIYFLSVRWT